MAEKKKIPDLVLLGPAGSGKGTQSALLEEEFGYVRVEAGALVRAKAQEDSEMGRMVKKISESGQLVPPHVVSDLLVDHIRSLPLEQHLLVDGYPRSQAQADDFDVIMKKAGRSLQNVRVLWLNVTFEEAKRRLLNRAQCSKCKMLFTNRDVKICSNCGGEVTVRKDDNVVGIAKRLALFIKETMDVIERYRAQGILVEINGDQPVVHVFEEIRGKVLQPYLQPAGKYDSD